MSHHFFVWKTDFSSQLSIIYICKKCDTSINREIKAEYPACPKCKANEFDEKKSIEVGNIFPLGTGFSLPFNLKFTDKDATEKPVLMGSYGIGLGRLMGAIVEASYDDKGIIWPKTVAPFLAHLVPVENNKKITTSAQKMYKSLQAEHIEVLYHILHLYIHDLLNH